VTPLGNDFDPNIKITLLPDRWRSERGTIGVIHSTYQYDFELWFKSGRIRVTYLPRR